MEFPTNREEVLAKVAQDGGALFFASCELQNDREVVLAALAQNLGALEHASAKLQNNKVFMLEHESAQARRKVTLAERALKNATAPCATARDCVPQLCEAPLRSVSSSMSTGRLGAAVARAAVRRHASAPMAARPGACGMGNDAP